MNGLRKPQKIVLNQGGWFIGFESDPSHNSNALKFQSKIGLLGSKTDDGMPV
jgi:hypothetical protein